ncbi:beta-flanking protein [Butyriboletus roseoflavus]|nr:beta-flanking protein [Butyriboletus roseoflavus]
MSSLFGLAEQVLSAATGGDSSESQPQHTVHKTGGQEYNTPHHRQQPQGGFNTQEVLSHAGDVDEEDQGYIANAIRHVHSNPQQHHEEVDEGDLSKYGPMVLSALSSVSSKSGIDVGSLMSGGLGEGGGNQLMGLVMKEAGNAFVGGSGGDKQSAMNGAAMTLAKLVAQKQLSAFIGGSNSGGLSMMEVGKALIKSRFA